MKKIVKIVALLFTLTGLSTAWARDVIDMQGRTVSVPEKISKIYGSAPPLTALLYALAPDMLVGVNTPFSNEDKAFLSPRAAALPDLGGVFGMGRQVNPETLLGIKPDVALAWKSDYIDQATIETPFKNIGVPLLYIKLDTLSDWPQALEYVGRLLGREARSKELAQYLRQTLSRVEKAVSGLSDSQKVRVYYAESPDGFATDCNRSFHTEAIELAGGYNVYRCEPKDHSGMERVSAEQILLFAPQLILSQDRSFLTSVKTDQRWKNIPAVQAGKVYAIPRSPFNWIDRPPSYMRAIAILWLTNMFYPDRLPLDIRKETKQFYRLFLNVNLSDANVEALLNPVPIQANENPTQSMSENHHHHAP